MLPLSGGARLRRGSRPDTSPSGVDPTDRLWHGAIGASPAVPRPRFWEANANLTTNYTSTPRSLISACRTTTLPSDRHALIARGLHRASSTRKQFSHIYSSNTPALAMTRVALVVGASRGIGRQIAIDLARDGYAGTAQNWHPTFPCPLTAQSSSRPSPPAMPPAASRSLRTPTRRSRRPAPSREKSQKPVAPPSPWPSTSETPPVSSASSTTQSR